MMARIGSTATLLAAAMPILGACGGGGGRDWAGTVTDSAGVEIVMNPASGIWSDRETPAVEQKLKIGNAGGDPNYQFGTIAAVDIGSEGTIYVLDQQAQQIRVYSPDGTYLRAIGKPGSGPGELSAGVMGLIVTRGDTILVPDMGQQRVTRYTADGGTVGSFPIPMTEGFAVRWLSEPGGRIVQQTRIMQLPGQTTTVEPKDLLLERDASGAIVDTVMVMPAGEQVRFTQSSMQIRLFEAEPVWGLSSGGRVFFAMNSNYSIGVYDGSGRLVRIVRKDVPRKEVTESDIQAIKQAMRKLFEDRGLPPQAMDPILSSISFADHYPAFANLMGGPGGSLWVQRVTSAQDIEATGAEFDPQDIGSPVWDVFGSNGRYLGNLKLPDRFQPLRVVDNDIWGVWRDELDVQYVSQVHVDITMTPLESETQTDD